MQLPTITGALMGLIALLPASHAMAALNVSTLAPTVRDTTCLESTTTCGPLTAQGYATLAVCQSGVWVAKSACDQDGVHACRFVLNEAKCVPGAGSSGLYMGGEADEVEATGKTLRRRRVAVVIPGAEGGSQLIVRQQSAKTIYTAQGLTECQYRLLLKITSIFETSNPNQIRSDLCGNWNDGQGISAGFIQFTTSSGSALQVVRTYLKLTTRPNPPLASFIPALERAAQVGNRGAVSGQGFMDGLWSFCSAWTEADRNDGPAFRRAQMQIQAQGYMAPNKPMVDRLGLRTALGVGQLMDTAIQLGSGAVATIAERAGWSPKDGASEADWLGRYLNARAEYLRRMGGAYAGTLYRIRAYQFILGTGNLNFANGAVTSLTNDGQRINLKC
ncbi:hypothetical protein HDU96_004570 [Phlyctochytrium bullatum]|nr:hypothetical protein HDU96_004570 [Phlyctochytrium bullatum]